MSEGSEEAMTERHIRVHLWEDRAAIVDTVADQPRCRVFFYWIEPDGQACVLLGAVEGREVRSACQFPDLRAGTTTVSVMERHFSKKLLGMWMASYVKEKAVELVRRYHNRGDVVHKIVEKHMPLGADV
jgi:hypothetical protein